MIDQFKRSGIDITVGQASTFAALTDFMLDYNQKVNLTRITDPKEIIEKHYIDSILPLTMIDVPRGTKIIDVGTGAGFPSLPMKIFRPDLDITMLDSLRKRITYLELVCKELNVDAVRVNMRSEDAGKDKKYREKYGIAVARAVAPLNVLAEYCLPFVTVGGYFLAMKGEKDESGDALSAISELGGKITEIKHYNLPSGDKRILIITKKIKETPQKYPRASAAISKKPL